MPILLKAVFGSDIWFLGMIVFGRIGILRYGCPFKLPFATGNES
ncbi:MAG: hypothetical protein RBR69_05850 [Candidatus Cloacimonadaceae bacterium]|jgi:hypothetical protein|nr:hypothetical protein [Candidatus Cloacimonadaceae bacterium]